MAWVYRQHSGELFHNGKRVARGYSGAGRTAGEGRNNHSLEWASHRGPIPSGKWKIGKAFHHPYKGPVTLPLRPADNNVAYYRDNFLIHGDSRNPTHAGLASEGCIILEPHVRHIIDQSSDRDLEVVP